MVNARDYGHGQTDIFAKTLVWKRDLHRYGQLAAKLVIADSAEVLLWLDGLNRYGQMCRELATTARGNPRWHTLQHEAAMLMRRTGPTRTLSMRAVRVAHTAWIAH